MSVDEAFVRRSVEALCQLNGPDAHNDEDKYTEARKMRPPISLDKFAASVSRIGSHFRPLLAALWADRLHDGRSFLSAPAGAGAGAGGTLGPAALLKRLRHFWLVFNHASREIAGCCADQAWAGPPFLKSMISAVAALIRETCLPHMCYGLDKFLAGEMMRYRQDPDSFQLEDLDCLQREVELLEHPGFEHLQFEYARLLHNGFYESVEPTVAECCLAFEKFGEPVLEGVLRSMECRLQAERSIDKLHEGSAWQTISKRQQQQPTFQHQQGGHPHNDNLLGLGFASMCADLWLALLRPMLPRLLHCALLPLALEASSNLDPSSGSRSSPNLAALRVLLDTAEAENIIPLFAGSLSEALKTLLHLAPKRQPAESASRIRWFLSVVDALHLACATLVPEDPASRLSSVFSPVVQEIFADNSSPDAAVDAMLLGQLEQQRIRVMEHLQRQGSSTSADGAALPLPLPSAVAEAEAPVVALDLSAALALHIDKALRGCSADATAATAIASTINCNDRGIRGLGSMLVMVHMAPADGLRHCLLAALRLLRLHIDDLKALPEEEKGGEEDEKRAEPSSFAGPVGSLLAAWKAASEGERPALEAALRALGADVKSLQSEAVGGEEISAQRCLPPHEELFRQFLQSELGPTHRSCHHFGEVVKDVCGRGRLVDKVNGSFQAIICAEASIRSLGLRDLLLGQPSLEAATLPALFRSSEPLADMKKTWISRYTQRFAHRRLEWQPLLGTALVKWCHTSRDSTLLLVSELQAHLLLVFNTNTEVAEEALRLAEAEWEGETKLTPAKAKSWELALEALLRPEGPLVRRCVDQGSELIVKPQRQPSPIRLDAVVDLAGLSLLSASDLAPLSSSSPWSHIVGCSKKSEDESSASRRSSDEHREGAVAVLEASIVRLLKRWHVLTFQELLEKVAKYPESLESESATSSSPEGAQRVMTVMSLALRSVSGRHLATRLRNLQERELLAISGDLDAFDLERNPSTRIEYLP